MKFGSSPARPVHAEPPPRPIAARPVCKRDGVQVEGRTGEPSQICLHCNEPSIEVRMGCSKRTCRGHLDMGAE
eukprot:4455901-Pyramimonas_sp.AAC.1